MQLSSEQSEQLEILLAALKNGERKLELAGPAGSGKTSCMRAFAERVEAMGYKTRFLAPTGKAANRLSSVSGREASTIHSALYARVSEGKSGAPVFMNAQPPCDPGTVIIVDEASMVDADLTSDLIENLPGRCAVLFTGDDEQLPPVSGEFGPDLVNPTARLTQIHRQAEENPILAVATQVRLGKGLPKAPCTLGDAFERRRSSIKEAASWLALAQREGRDAVLLCWTNETRRALNQMVRKRREFSAAIEPDERLVVCSTNRRLNRVNGEVLVVDRAVPVYETHLMTFAAQSSRDASDDELNAWKVTFKDGRSAIVEDRLFGRDNAAFKKFVKRAAQVTEPWHWLFCDYGHAITIHKSQGSEYAEVGIVIDSSTRTLGKQDPVMARKLAYTAVTRGKQRVVVFDVD